MMLGDEDLARSFSARLFEEGVFASAICFPMVRAPPISPYSVPGSPHGMLVELRQALYFLPGSPHGMLVELRQGLIPYQGHRMV